MDKCIVTDIDRYIDFLFETEEDWNRKFDLSQVHYDEDLHGFTHLSKRENITDEVIDDLKDRAEMQGFEIVEAIIPKEVWDRTGPEEREKIEKKSEHNDVPIVYDEDIDPDFVAIILRPIDVSLAKKDVPPLVISLPIR